MTFNRLILCVTVLGILAVSVSVTQAQRTGTTGGTGSTGNSGNTRTQGGGVATGTYVQDFSFDSFSISNSNTGNNRTGNTGNNRTGNAGNNNFIGSSNNTFIGSSTAGTAANRNTTARAANMTAATRNRATNANRIPGQMGGGGTAINNRTQVQPVIVLGFTTPKADAAAVSAILSQRIEHTTQTGRLGAVQIELADGVAVARGTVASDHDRRVAVNMIRLQPGVFEIDDDIQIETPAMPRNTLSPSAGRNQQTINFDDATTPQGRPLVYVF